MKKYFINESPKLHYKQEMIVTMHTNYVAVRCYNVVLSDKTLFVFFSPYSRIHFFFQKVNMVFSLYSSIGLAKKQGGISNLKNIMTWIIILIEHIKIQELPYFSPQACIFLFRREGKLKFKYHKAYARDQTGGKLIGVAFIQFCWPFPLHLTFHFLLPSSPKSTNLQFLLFPNV